MVIKTATIFACNLFNSQGSGLTNIHKFMVWYDILISVCVVGAPVVLLVLRGLRIWRKTRGRPMPASWHRMEWGILSLCIIMLITGFVLLETYHR